MIAALARESEAKVTVDFFWEIDLTKLYDHDRNAPAKFTQELLSLLQPALGDGLVDRIATFGDGMILPLGKDTKLPRNNQKERWRIFLTGKVAVEALQRLSNGGELDEAGRRFADQWQPMLEAAGIESGDLWRMQTALSVWPQLDASVPEIEADAPSLPDMGTLFDGRGVIVGVVDFGCDVTHPNFRNAAGATRLLSLWDQNMPSDGSGPFGYGREFDAAKIDAALTHTDSPDYVEPGDAPFWVLRYDPHDNYYADVLSNGAHGTHVLDIAAGNGRATHLANAHAPGVAPAADIVFVQVRKPDTVGGRKLLSFAEVIRGAQYVFLKAQALGQPAVVNISLNTMAGPHDGTSIAARMLDALAIGPGRAIVVAAGNFGGSMLHVRETLRRGATVRLPWIFAAGDRSRNDVAIWYDGPPGLELTVEGPEGRDIAPVTVAPGDPDTTIKDGARTIGFVSNDAGAADRPNVMLVGLNPIAAAEAETWTLSIAFIENPPAGASDPAIIDAWIDRDDEGQSTFDPRQVSERGTLGTIACGKNTIVVGGYYASAPNTPALRGASQGPTRDHRTKPDVSAPGRSVRAALSKGYRPRFDDNDKWRSPATVSKDGTSMAAPHVTGTIALMLQKNPTLTPAAIRDILIETARPAPEEVDGDWNPSFGYGRIAAAPALKKVPPP